MQCRNRSYSAFRWMGRRQHRHLVNGLAKQTENYTAALVDTILQGFVNQLEHDAGQRTIGALSVGPMEVGPHMYEDAINWDDPAPEALEVYDQISGALLDSGMVRQARAEEIDFVHRFGVYRKVPAAEAVGKLLVPVKWCDLNKCDLERPLCRSRLLACELKMWNPMM